MDRNELLQVYGHVRSGNNLLAACLRLNFYPDLDLKGVDGLFGHWSDRQPTEGSVYGKLIGSHEHYPAASPTRRAVYVHRDGHAVAHSVWRSAHFTNIAWRDVPFSAFLRRPLDWDASPGRRRRRRWYQKGENIVQHWRRHVTGWLDPGDPDFCYVRYEDLVENPSRVIQGIRDFFGLQLAEPAVSQGIQVPAGLVGFSPNQGSSTSWHDAYSERDLKFYRSIVGDDVDELRAAHAVGAS